ncbi:DUF2325 domain-containing protein [Quatrionicoccus australiensis]|uniref:DUF2325 domain-containing protein n=1 Tax=Quatrionicoccus australiensis TaxID=138118 RepID=UPI001CFA8590|nr:DUF2325 domain-containing protein [Quatrionicoccus australiensis]MCB4358813.1 DUF2325 domain-containing protein [Quatrionicoccus australiensis]
MAALIVGGDRVGNYKDFLAGQGYLPVRHWSGRNQSECHRRIPLDTRVIVVMVDQINHGLARKIRRAADEMSVPVVFSKRSVVQLSSVLAGVAA